MVSLKEYIAESVSGIRAIKAAQSAHREKYEKEQAEFESQISAIHKKRGFKPKEKSWAGYEEPGRSRTRSTPHG